MKKSAELILPEPLRTQLGQVSTRSLVCRFPYDLIGEPGEVEWPYSKPHVFPCSYVLKATRREAGAVTARPVICRGDGEWVIARRGGVFREFPDDVRLGAPPSVPCHRHEDGHAQPCPFSVPDTKGVCQCQAVGTLHLLVPIPLPTGGYRMDAATWGLEVPPSRIGQVTAQLRVLRDQCGGKLTTGFFLLTWEPAQTQRPEGDHLVPVHFFAPVFQLLAVSAELSPTFWQDVASLAVSGPALTEEPALVSEEEEDAGGEDELNDLQALLASSQAGGKAGRPLNTEQERSIRELLQSLSLDGEAVAQALYGVPLAELTHAQAAAFLRVFRQEEARATLRAVLGSGAG